MKRKHLFIILLATLIPWGAMAQKTHIANTSSSTQMTWDEFADIVNNGTTYEGMTVYLDEDITASDMMGSSTYPFKGTFDGQGHTLTFNKGTSSSRFDAQNCAPFRAVSGATFRNLKVTGTIYTSMQFASGFVAQVPNDGVTFINCESNINIDSYRPYANSQARHAGFVAIHRRGTASFEGCSFTGQLVGNNGENDWGGFIAEIIDNNGTAQLANCVFAPTQISVNTDGSFTFVRPRPDNAGTIDITITNCYYTQALGTAQGKQRYTITAVEPVTAELNGTATNHNVSHITAYSGTPGLLYNGTIIAGSADPVSLNLSGSDVGYLVDHGTLTGTANPYTLTMEAYNAVISPIKTHIASTSSSTTMTWNEFAENVNNGITYEGLTVYLDEDITAHFMAGTSSTNCFKGTLEGNSHTLTFNYFATQEWTAPFKYLNGATIQNLKVDGTITTYAHRCAGLVAQSYGNTTITNCLSDITINSSFSGDGSHGGFVSFVYGSTTIEGCTFTGRILGDNTYSCAGFIGWVSGSAVFNNCVFAATQITVGYVHSATFGRRDINYAPSSITVNNCYYTFDFNDGTNHVGQGKQRYTIIGQSPVSIALNGTATDHGVSHITAYNGTPGLLYNGTIIAGEGDQVRLNLNGGNSYLATHGTLTGNSNPHILTMEASNTEISAAPLYSTDFEDGCDWTFVNGNLTNKWYWGYAASNGGTHGLYISNNGGTTNTYTKSSSAMVYAYKTLDFEAGVYSFSYDWLANGEHNWDFLRVALVPASVSLEASTEMPTGFHNNTLPEGWIALDGGSQLNQSGNWQTETLEIELSAAGQYMMVFAWRNDGFDGTNPPAAIDNVRIEEVITPVNLTVSNVTATTADLSWTALIPTDSYTMKYRPFGIVFTEGFENGLDDWTLNNCDANTGIIYGNDAHSGGTMFGFHNNTNPPQYLISPKLSGVTEGMRLEFYYNNWSSNWPETFQVGFSTTDNATESFTFGDEITVTDVEWHLYSETIPAGTKYISWKHTSYDQLYLYIDDIMVGTGIPAGAWQTATVAGGITEVSTTLTGLTPATNYEAYVYPDCDPDKMSDTVRFTTEASSVFSITIAGYGTTDNNWRLIALPVISISPDNVEGMTTGDYDLYRFNPTNEDNEWENYKDGSFNLEAEKGYLYARSTDDTLSFVGASYSGYGEIELVYDANDEHKCWNLIGNPYNTPARIDKPFYRMNEGGTALSAQVEAGSIVEAMEGVFVQATAASQSATFTPIATHEYVDLGLPSGLLWATCNVGADTPEDYGDYFAWGETTPKGTYDWSTYQYCMGSQNTMTKYCQNSNYGYNGFTDELTTLEPSDDAATANWGSGWRTPTQAEFEELYYNTTVTWTTQNGVNGYLFTAPNGNSLFLPAAGYRWNEELSGGAGDWGYYWSSSLNTGNPNSAWDFRFSLGSCSMSGYPRDYGQSVRAVRSAE